MKQLLVAAGWVDRLTDFFAVTCKMGSPAVRLSERGQRYYALRLFVQFKCLARDPMVSLRRLCHAWCRTGFACQRARAR